MLNFLQNLNTKTFCFGELQKKPQQILHGRFQDFTSLDKFLMLFEKFFRIT